MQDVNSVEKNKREIKEKELTEPCCEHGDGPSISEGYELSKSKTYLSPVANMDSSSSLTLAVISGPMALASMLMQVNTEGSTTHDRVFLNTTYTHTLSATSGEHQGVNHPRLHLLKHTHCQQHQVNTKGSTTHNCLPEHNTHTVINIR